MNWWIAIYGVGRLGYDLPDHMTRQNISADMICGEYVLAPTPPLYLLDLCVLICLIFPISRLVNLLVVRAPIISWSTLFLFLLLWWNKRTKFYKHSKIFSDSITIPTSTWRATFKFWGTQVWKLEETLTNKKYISCIDTRNTQFIAHPTISPWA